MYVLSISSNAAWKISSLFSDVKDSVAFKFFKTPYGNFFKNPYDLFSNLSNL